MNSPQNAVTAYEKEAGPAAKQGPATASKSNTRRQATDSNNRLQARFSSDLLESLRTRLPDYLTATGLELRKVGNRLLCHCPVHADTHPSFAVFADGKACGCFPCDWRGDVFGFARWTGRASTFPEAVRHVASVLGVYLPEDGTRPPQATTRPAAPLPERKPEPPFTLPDAERELIHAARLAFSDAFDAGELDSMAANLGLPLWVFRWAAKGTSGLGIHKGMLAYLYPQGMKIRRPEGSKPRFVWEVGKPTEPWRMGWMQPEIERVFLTEGESDCMALIAAGLEADGKTLCVASPGTSFPAAWGPLFTGKRVVLCFDTDTAGKAASAKVAAILKPHAASVKAWKGCA